MRILRFLPTSLLLLTLVCSCSTSYYPPKYYTPPGVNVPGLKNQGELQVSLNSSSGISDFPSLYVRDHFDGFEYQVAYSPFKNLGIMANTSLLSLGTDRSGSATAKMGEIGLGYYSPLTDKILWELYAGTGKGSMENEVTVFVNNKHIETDFNRHFIQPGLGIAGEYLEVFITSRVSATYYTHINQIRPQSLSQDPSLKRMKENPLFFHFEPTATIRGGSNHIKLQLQFIMSDVLSRRWFFRHQDVGRAGMSLIILLETKGP